MDEGVGLYERKERTLDPGGPGHQEPFEQHGGEAPSAGVNRPGREDAEMITAAGKRSHLCTSGVPAQIRCM